MSFAPEGTERNLLVTDEVHAGRVGFSQRRAHQSRLERGARLPQCFPLGEG